VGTSLNRVAREYRLSVNQAVANPDGIREIIRFDKPTRARHHFQSLSRSVERDWLKTRQAQRSDICLRGRATFGELLSHFTEFPNELFRPVTLSCRLRFSLLLIRITTSDFPSYYGHKLRRARSGTYAHTDHPGGCHVAFVDGIAHFLAQDIDAAPLCSRTTRREVSRDDKTDVFVDSEAYWKNRMALRMPATAFRSEM